MPGLTTEKHFATHESLNVNMCELIQHIFFGPVGSYCLSYSVRCHLAIVGYLENGKTFN